MANLISSNSTTGVYLVIEENGQIAGNTPGGIDLDNLVLASGYMYFDDFVALTMETTTPLNDNFTGWQFAQNNTVKLKTTGFTGFGKLTTLTLTVHVTATTQANFLKFFELHQNISNYQLYLLRQWAATTFKQFPFNTNLLNYVAVILTGNNLVETNKEGKDVQTLVVKMVNAYRTVTP